MKNKLFIIAVLFCGCNLTVFAETLIVRTITEALNYSGNKNRVTKLVITDSIVGNDYSVGSEWREFRTLDETFPNIEAMEILTDQDIPDGTIERSLFCWSERVPDPFGAPFIHFIHHSAKWLKYFSAPNVRYIGSRTFAHCENLIDVNFPLATTIGEFAFQRCIGLTSINFPLVTTMENFAFHDCSGLISADFPLVETIGHSAFWNCRNLSSVNFPSAKTIESMAFTNCVSLVTVDFPLVETIGFDAFNGCFNLVSVNFPLLQTIGSGAFASCTGLISVDFPSVRTIGHSAFSTCLNLISANFPLVQTIENFAFYRCNSLASISFGTGFTEPTEIIFRARVFLHDNVFSTVRTQNIDLTLGEYVLPKPNLSARIWQNTNGINDGTSHLDFDYVWRSITIKEVSANIEETVKNCTVNIYPNPVFENFTISGITENALVKITDLNGRIVLQQTIAPNEQVLVGHLSAGIYFVRVNEETVKIVKR